MEWDGFDRMEWDSMGWDGFDGMEWNGKGDLYGRLLNFILSMSRCFALIDECIVQYPYLTLRHCTHDKSVC